MAAAAPGLPKAGIETLDASSDAQGESFVPLEVYLSTSYRPDQEYLDGRLLERNLGEIPHARLQGFFSWLFRVREAEWKLCALPEQRVQVAPTRFRVPDVCVVPLRIEDKRFVRTPPLLCIEVLSPEDRMSEMQERVDDYLRMGVGAVWVIDPKRRRVFSVDANGRLAPELERLRLADSPVEVPIAEIFAELDRYDSQ